MEIILLLELVVILVVIQKMEKINEYEITNSFLVPVATASTPVIIVF